MLIARDPPADGRPAGLRGRRRTRSRSRRRWTRAGARVGDPLVLHLTVSGVGNVSLFPRPRFVLPWAQTVAGAEHVVVDSTSTLVQGRKEFEWVVTPQREGAVEVPAVRYPYFNPYTEQYEVALSRPLAVTVRRGALAVAAPDSAPATPRLRLRARYRGELAEPLTSTPGFWLGMAIAPFPALVLGALRRPRAGAPPVAQGAPAGAPGGRAAVRPPPCAGSSRRHWWSAPGSRWEPRRPMPARSRARCGGPGSPPRRAQGVAPRPGRAQPAPSTAGAAPSRRTSPGGRSTSTSRWTRRPNHRQRPSAGASVPVALLLAALVTGAAWGASAADDDAARFARGVALYGQGDDGAAAREFGAIVRHAPRAADAWANLGTVAWQMHDTAAAAVGWQRALRLEPLADDMRQRLEADARLRRRTARRRPARPARRPRHVRRPGLARGLGARRPAALAPPAALDPAGPGTRGRGLPRRAGRRPAPAGPLRPPAIRRRGDRSGCACRPRSAPRSGRT